MAQQAREGSVYRIDLHNGKPAHYWIVLNEPQALDGRFLTVSLTDRHHFNISDVWPFGYEICADLHLAKPSVVQLQYTLVQQQGWLNEHGADYICNCSPAVLKRARCNLLWYPQHLKPDVVRFLNFHKGAWDVDCGSAPAHIS